MGIQSHFVVAIDENGQAKIDYEVSINFDNGNVWNEEEEQWSYHIEGDEFTTHYETAEKLLTTLVQQTWKVN